MDVCVLLKEPTHRIADATRRTGAKSLLLVSCLRDGVIARDLPSIASGGSFRRTHVHSACTPVGGAAIPAARRERRPAARRPRLAWACGRLW